ncbi:MAG: hypothetical protein H6569_11260 [Lewinellaceae bacterium]|nr:hypothetical protein [Lewinellaceae bacterium]
MVSKHWLRLLLPVLVFGSLTFACKKISLDDAEIAGHTAEYAFPLMNTTLNLKDLMFKILNDTLSGDTIVVNPDNTMTLYYSGDLAEKPATDIFEFFKFPDGGIPVPDTFFKFNLDVPDSVFIHRADVLTGDMNVVVYNGFTEPVNGFFTIPQMSKNGIAFKYPFNIPASQTSFSPLFDLAGYTFFVGQQHPAIPLRSLFAQWYPGETPGAIAGTPGLCAVDQQLHAFLRGRFLGL